MANEPRKPFQSPAPLPLPTPASSTKDKDKGGAALPLWNSGGTGDKLGGMPLFRGAAQKSGGVLGRLKGLKTKDVAFIGAGLAVLVMAPLAEYLISEGEDKAGQLQGGFANNSSPFNEGRDPSEIGIMGLARGGVPGDGSDVITPLNARDPSSLIMGGTGEKQEAPAAAAVEPKRDAPKDSVWDKVVSSAKSGATAATRKVSLPKPGGKLAGAINGLRSLSGGSTGASLKLAAPDSKGLFSAPKNQSSLAATQPVPGYRGAGSRSPAGGSGGNSTGRFGGGFGGPGGGAAGDVMSGGISGGGRGNGFSGGDGDPTKSPGGNSTKDAKTLGESLAFLRQKMEMEKAIDLKWAKKRYDELERKKMIEQTLVQTAQQAFMKVLDKLLEGKKDGGGSPGGGSPGGGSPGGGKPETGKPGENGNPTGVPSANPANGPGGVSASVAHAQEGAQKSRKEVTALGETAKALGADQTALNDLATKIGTISPNPNNPNDPAPAAAAAVTKANTSVASAKTVVDNANTELGKQVGVAEKTVKSFDGVIGKQNDSLTAMDKRKTDMGAELAKLTVEVSGSGSETMTKYGKGGATGAKLGGSIPPDTLKADFPMPDAGKGGYAEQTKGALADLTDAKTKVLAMQANLKPNDPQRKLVDGGLKVIEAAIKDLDAGTKSADSVQQVLVATGKKLDETKKAFDEAETKRTEAKKAVEKQGKETAKFIDETFEEGDKVGDDPDQMKPAIKTQTTTAAEAAKAEIEATRKKALEAKKALKGG